MELKKTATSYLLILLSLLYVEFSVAKNPSLDLNFDALLLEQEETHQEIFHTIVAPNSIGSSFLPPVIPWPHFENVWANIQTTTPGLANILDRLARSYSSGVSRRNSQRTFGEIIMAPFIAKQWEIFLRLMG